MWTYSPKEVYINLALAYAVKGTSEDVFFRVVKDEDSFTTHKGGAGGVARSYNPDKTYSVFITVPQTSPANKTLNLLNTIDEASRRGIFPLFCKDGSGGSLFFSPSCWIVSRPDVSFSSTMSDYEWELKASDLVFGVSGNAERQNTFPELDTLVDTLLQYGNNSGVF